MRVLPVSVSEVIRKDHMKFAITLVIALASLASSVGAFADSQDTTVATVPFDFVVGNKTLSAGTYSINRISDNPLGPLLIRSTDGSTAAMFLPTTSESVTGNDNPELVFQHDGDTYFLSQVVAEMSTYTFAKDRSKMRMAASPAAGAVSPSS
jgi:hypothetical protein